MSVSKEYMIPGYECGASFAYLGRHCVVMRYAGESEACSGGDYGLVYEYADKLGVIHSRTVAPCDFHSFAIAAKLLSAR